MLGLAYIVPCQFQTAFQEKSSNFPMFHTTFLVFFAEFSYMFMILQVLCQKVVFGLEGKRCITKIPISTWALIGRHISFWGHKTHASGGEFSITPLQLCSERL